MSNGANSKPKLVDTGQKSWQNAHVTYTQPLRHFYDLWNPTEGDSFDRYNATTSAIMDLIGQAQTENLGLRALGGGDRGDSEIRLHDQVAHRLPGAITLRCHRQSPDRDHDADCFRIRVHTSKQKPYFDAIRAGKDAVRHIGRTDAGLT